MKKRRLIMLVGLLFGASAAALAQGPEGPAVRLKVCVSIDPQVYFVERVGGERVEVEALLPPGQSPHTYEPTPRKLSLLASARVFFRIGVPYETRLMAKIASLFGGLEVVDTRQGVPLREIDGPEGEPAHEKSSARENTHAGADPHIWLAPQLVKIQARTICDWLCRADPKHAGEYLSNLSAFQSDLDTVDTRIESLLRPFHGETVYVFHPAFGYFTDSYGLRQVAVETGGHEPSARELAGLIESMRRQKVQVVFVQPEFAGNVAAALEKALGVRVVRLYPLARDYLANLQSMAGEIAGALKGSR